MATVKDENKKAEPTARQKAFAGWLALSLLHPEAEKMNRQEFADLITAMLAKRDEKDNS